MKTDFYPETLGIQASMTAAAATEFTESNLNHLRTLIRLTVEFRHFLNDTHRAPDPDGLIYCCDSIIAGVDSFYDVNTAYKLLDGSRRSRPQPGSLSSLESLTDQFNDKYREFLIGTDLEKRCRLLLDLFKLQISFVAIAYP